MKGNMDYSTQRVVSDGTLINLLLTIDYLNRDEIRVLYDNVAADDSTWDWVGVDEKALVFMPAVPNGVEVRIQRVTNIGAVRHVFSGGAQFRPITLDENATQLLHAVQEIREGSTLTDIFTQLDVHGNRIVNLPAAVADGEPVTLGQYNAGTTGLGAAVSAAQASAAAAADSAASLLAPGGIGSAQLADSAVATAKLADEAVTDAKVATNAAISAGKLAFLQAGTGAVSDTLGARGKLTLYLWDYLSTAQRASILANNGAVDCTVALQAVTDYASSLRTVASGYPGGGAVVVLPAGRIRFTEVVRKNGVSYIGQGRYITVLLMSENGGTGFKSPAAITQNVADNIYWLDDADYSIVPNPAISFTTPTVLWDMTGFSRVTWRNLAFAFKANIIAVSVKGATLAGSGGPAQWYNAFYDIFMEGEATGGIGWDLGDTAADKEQITTWNWYGGRVSGNSVSGTGMRLNSATGCNLYGVCFEGLTDELIIGSAGGARGCQQVALFGCYFEGSGTGYTIHPNAESTVIMGGFSTGVINTNSGVRSTIIGDGVTTMPVANAANTYVLQQASPVFKPKVRGSSLPGIEFENDGGSKVTIANGSSVSSGSSYLSIENDLGHDLLKVGVASASIYPSQLFLANQAEVSITISSGTPEGTFAASPGSLYLRTNGGAGTSLYVKESGFMTNTGWVAK